MLLDKLDAANMHGLDTSNVSSRGVTSQVKFELISTCENYSGCNSKTGASKR